MSYDPLVLLCKAHGLPEPETEVVFAPPRRFRADYLFRAAMVIVEREGGLFSRSEAAQRAHTRPLHILRDMEKSNLAQSLGYIYLRFTPRQLETHDTLEFLKQFIGTETRRIYTDTEKQR